VVELPAVVTGIWRSPVQAKWPLYADDPIVPTFSSSVLHGRVRGCERARILEPWRSQSSQSGATNSANQAAHAVFCDVRVSVFGQGSYRQKSLVLTHSWAILQRFNAVCRSKKRDKTDIKAHNKLRAPHGKGQRGS